MKLTRKEVQSWIDARRIITKAIGDLRFSPHQPDDIAVAILARLAKDYLLVVHCDEVEFKADLEAAKEA